MATGKMDNPDQHFNGDVTDPSQYRQPISAVHTVTGRAGKLLGTANLQGRSPGAQFVDESTGRVFWDNLDRFQVIDPALVSSQALRNISSGQTGTPGMSGR